MLMQIQNTVTVDALVHMALYIRDPFYKLSMSS